MPDEIGGGSVNLITTDAGDLYDQIITGLQDAIGEPLYPGDERRIMGEAIVAVSIPLQSSVQDAARQVMLRYARGEVLDALGERLGVKRIPAVAAVTQLKFTLSEARREAVIIPKWTKATDGNIYFATDDEAVIEAGETTVTVPATCTGAGSIGNGYPPGTIATLVDLIAYVEKVENTVETAGGDDGETYTVDGDDRYRERIRIAPSALSTAGPERAYVYWAKTADAGIKDVAAISETETYTQECDVVDGKVYIGGELLVPDGLTVNGQAEGFSYEYENALLVITLQEPLSQEESVTVALTHKMDGRVRIVVLMDDGELPDDEVLKKVYDAVNAKDVRPMTDVVSVAPAEPVDFDIKLTYTTTPELEAATVQMVEGEGGAIARYVADQCSILGRDINPDVLKTYIMRPDWDDTLSGAIRVDIEEPKYKAVADGQVAHFSGTVITSHNLETQARWDT